MQEMFFKIWYFERGILKSLKKLTLFFLSYPVPFKGQNYQKQKESGTSDQSLLRLPSNFTNWCKPIHDIINYSTFICPFESGKCGKDGKKLQKFEYLEKKKSILDEIKSIFHRF